MIEICEDAVETGSTVDYCVGVRTIATVMDAFAAAPDDIGAFFDLFRSARDMAAIYNPWSTLLVDRPDDQAALQEAGIVNRIRGGLQSRTTARFNLSPLVGLAYESAQNITAESGGNPFEEYVFVSNGVSASAAAILPYTCSQLWKNAEITGARHPVTLVGYGGTGNADDMILSSIPASVQGVNIEFPLIGDAALQL